jgi:hypothetical protein
MLEEPAIRARGERHRPPLRAGADFGAEELEGTEADPDQQRRLEEFEQCDDLEAAILPDT